MKFIKKPFKERIKNTMYLISNSFTVIGLDEDIKTPTYRIITLSLITNTLFFLSVASFFYEPTFGMGIPVLFLVLFILVPFKFVYDVRQKACQSWIVYNAISGKDISYPDSYAHTKKEKGRLRIIAIINLVMTFVGNQRSQNKGVISVIMNLFLAALMEIWDLLSHYMIPAIVIDQKPLKELVGKLKHLKKNVPATLVGVFGIDFVGNVVHMALTPIYILFIIIGIALTFLLAESLGALAFLPLIVFLYIVVTLSIIINNLVGAIKVIYFTIFYTTITRPTKIKASLKKQLTSYLKMKE